MANAMLEEDFKASHPDLQSYEEEHHDLIDKPKANLPTRKSVDFAILPPPKRSKPNVPWTTKQVIDAINISISPEERLEAVQKAVQTFHHDVEAVHNEEIATGADVAMTKHLTFLVHRVKHLQELPLECDSIENIRAEISWTCDALESLYRASSHVVGASFKRMGNELMQLTIQLIDEEIFNREVIAAEAEGGQDISDERPATEKPGTDEGRRSITPPPPPNVGGDLLLRKAMKILGHFARVGDATKPMAYFPSLLGSLVKLITLRPYESAPWEARLSALWTIANLACNAENMQMMACTPNLVDALVEVACRPLHEDDSVETTMEILRSRSIACRAILNLSWAPENKVSLAEHQPLINLLVDLIALRTLHTERLNNSRTVREILSTTRCHAAGAMRNLAAAPRRVKIGLCEYKNGYLLDVLTDAALNDPDTAVKDRAFATIHNLAVKDTAETIISHPVLVSALKDVLLSSSEEELSSQADGSIKEHASATLLVLERTITPSMDSYENLRDLLEAVNPRAAESSGEEDDEVTNAAAV